MTPTAIHHRTECLTVDQAKAITNSIRQHVEISLVYIKQAYAGRAWISLGYGSWEEYITAEIGDHVRLPRADRRDAVLELHDAGMSTRAIASVTGASKSTIANDIAGVQNRTPDPADNDVIDAEVIDEPAAPANVIGTDGKTYTLKPAPSKPRRRPLSQDIEGVCGDILKLANRITRITSDDRFDQVRGDIRLTNTLTHAISEACDLLEQVKGGAA